MNIKKFEHSDARGNSWGVVSAEQQWGQVYALKYNKPENRIASEIWRGLFTQAYEAAIAFGAHTINCRVRKEYEPAVFGEVLTKLGLIKKNERIEYKCNIIDLPGEGSTPFVWKTASELKWNEFQIASFLGLIVQDAIDVDPDEKPEEFMQDFLYHSELTHGPECIAIGFFDGIPCALVVAQTHPGSGWSRLSYMGITPKYRNQGLGKWVHRHGFEMMKAQGGKLYHGGTDFRNIPMQKLFEKHGCIVFCEMEEWQR